jgi:hypothetical protein
MFSNRKGPAYPLEDSEARYVDQLASDQHPHNHIGADRQQDDAEWFERHPRENLRIREIRDGDGIAPHARRHLCVGVSRTGCRGFMYRGNLRHMGARS